MLLELISFINEPVKNGRNINDMRFSINIFDLKALKC